MKDLVSIIIPIYNKAEYLERSIQSALNQTYTNIEVILINDGSTDNSENIIWQFRENDNRIIYKSVENGGVSRARNLGIKIAKGKYISFLDADDSYEITFIEKMLHILKENEICYCGHFLVDSSGVKKKAPLQFKENDIIAEYLLNTNAIHLNSWLIKKEFLMRNDLFFDESLNWGEDILFFSKILTINKEVKVMKEYLTNYSIELPNSLSSNNLDKIEKDMYCMNLYKEFLRNVEQDIKRMNRIVACIDQYRLPALIIFRLYNNRNIINQKTYVKYDQYINKLSCINGLRSLKLYIYKFKLERVIK